MKNTISFIAFLLSTFCLMSCNAQTLAKEPIAISESQVLPGAYSIKEYITMLREKKVAVVANHTSLINQTHLVDTLLTYKINIVKIFAPEHGFRGMAQAGEKVNTSKDETTGLPIISLYGKHLKPTMDEMKDIDIIIFDIQDVGIRFYTYISTLQYVMEACAEAGKMCLVLDRPNPNGFYIDGPVLNPEMKSFVGMQPIPVVYGMTIGEYAVMINNEGWLQDSLRCILKVFPCKNYTHSTRYALPVAPSPNLRSEEAVLLYPSICFFEGTPISLGRGTEKPFTIIGFPAYADKNFSFKPKSKSKNYAPPYQDTLCYGVNLVNQAWAIREQKQLNLTWLIDMFNAYPDKEKFFWPFFDKLAGTSKLKEQIKQGLTAKDISLTWKPELENFKNIRKKYLMYGE
ncbi:MAG: DUF1343 domain-containing protein [Bacteroidetes bacterium]|nr:DUF1343 domain-containing protein [Bacteroidota bacterium]